MSQDLIAQLDKDLGLISNSVDQILSPISQTAQNSLADIVTGDEGYPGNWSYPWTKQISRATTVFTNLRWYLVSNMRQLLSEAYVEIGLIQTICDVPVDDGLRGGITIKSKQLEEDQIALIKSTMDHEDDINIAGQAVKWNRLFGGAGVLILTDQDPVTPLRPLKPGDTVDFRAVDMWELFWDKQETEGYDPTVQQHSFEYYSYYGEKVHKSRVLRLTGLTAPSFIRPRLRGWGFSVVEALVRSINQYLKATDLSFEVLDEFKLDVYKIKNLTAALMSSQGTNKIKERVALANYQKNYQHAVVMDTEDDFDHKQLSFSGLAEAMAGIRMQVAADMRMPITKLFGISSAGFNSGEDDIEVYNAMVESQVRNKIKYHLLTMVELRCQSLFGFVPDDLDISFEPLRVLSAEQEENVKTMKFNRAIQSYQAGLITNEQFIEICNKSELFDVVLDNEIELDAYMDDTVLKAGSQGEGGADEIITQSAPQKSKSEGSQAMVKDAKPSKSPTAAEDATTPEEGETKDALKARNSLAFDRAAYEADGGERWIDSRRKEFFMNPGKVDEALWARAKEASQKAFGEERWQFVAWWYKKQGGKFH